MKKILVLTDFSDNANHAAQVAARMALRLQTDLLLYNAYLKAPMIPVLAEKPWSSEGDLSWGDSAVEKLDLLAGELRLEIENMAEDERRPKVFCSYGEGDLGVSVKNLCKEHHIDLVVMGSRAGGSINHLFFGSDSGSVINQACVPVLVIPPKNELDSIDHIMLATNFNTGDWEAVKYLVALSEIFKSEINIVHVQLSADEPDVSEQERAKFLKHLNQLHNSKISYHQIRGRNVLTRLSHLCKESRADVLALVHHKRSLLEGLLQQSVSKKALSAQKLPLLIFPSMS
ncbi:universal stress protein [Mucilaginibacter sp. RS28]|uniref:Universal stress protein n=1 Tax=Mucilaginibacter straminoryzae TaxID=2932774 RepID=A0A9X1X0X8_9SPHI|nr:universal stress protein [Mucilaginibacter straminoryzae]MCJ8208355.1 universal stress protein [Mucilaginibacter straminoryzae]